MKMLKWICGSLSFLFFTLFFVNSVVVEANFSPKWINSGFSLLAGAMFFFLCVFFLLVFLWADSKIYHERKNNHESKKEKEEFFFSNILGRSSTDSLIKSRNLIFLVLISFALVSASISWWYSIGILISLLAFIPCQTVIFLRKRNIDC